MPPPHPPPPQPISQRLQPPPPVMLPMPGRGRKQHRGAPSYLHPQVQLPPAPPQHVAGHPGKKCYPCNYCVKKFNRVSGRSGRSWLNDHLREAHPGKKRFPCKKGCDMSFDDKSSCDHHEMGAFHTSDRTQYICEYCEGKFKSVIGKSGLDDHLRKAHPGKKRFPCRKGCDYSNDREFLRDRHERSLKQHMKKHPKDTFSIF